MSFIQCRSEKEVKERLEGKLHAFITEDHRIYEEVLLSDDNCFYTFNSETAVCLLNLQHEIERMGEDFNSEMSFHSVERYAKELREAFEKALAAVKFKPLTRKKR